MKKIIDRINELARKAKEGPLTTEEEAERAELRKKYIQSITGQVRNNLKHIKFVDEDGKERPDVTTKGEQGNDN